jgi:hypothetical protein
MCFGPAYFISGSAVDKLVQAHEAQQYPVIALEDVYVTGYSDLEQGCQIYLVTA